MLNHFRRLKHSKIGTIAALAFLVLIGLSFAAGDISSSRQFGGIGGGDSVATVGDRKIATADLSSAAKAGLDRARQENPRLSMTAYLVGGGLDEALTQMIDRAAIAVFGEQHGLVASDRLVDSEIAKIPAFQGPDGKFSESAYKALLAQQGLTDAAIRRDLADGLVARQLLLPAAFGAQMPVGVASRYAALLADRRTGSIAIVPAAAFAPKAEPSPAELAAWYTAHKSAYIRPERRTLRYALFDERAVKSVAAPTDAEIAARYNADKALYAPSESRKLTQLVLPSEADARAAIAAGKSLEAAAAAKGLAVAPLGPVTRAALATQANAALADAAFAATRGALVGPIRGPLGWTVLRIDAVQANPGKTLDQAHAEITATLAAQKKRAALSDYSAKIEDAFDNGSSLADVAKEFGLTIQQSPELTADGKVYGPVAAPVAPELARVVSAAFAMEREGAPQVAEAVPGQTFVVFDVARITPSAAAPIAEIRPQVMADYMIDKGALAAKAAAEKVLAAVRKGKPLGAALSGLGVAGLPPAQQVEFTRDQIAQAGRVPAPIALLFSMAQGTTKLLAAEGNRGWYVISLAKIVPGDDKAIQPVMAATRAELGQITGREYAEALRSAMRDEVGVKRNPAGIEAVRRQLGGEGN